MVLGACPQALHLCLGAPPSVRVERVVREEGLSEAEAWDRLRRVDRLRSAFLRELYGRNPADPTLNHLVFDTAALSLDVCLEAAAAGAVNPWSCSVRTGHADVGPPPDEK